MKQKAVWALLMTALLLSLCALAQGEETRLEPQWPVPERVQWLLEVASGEVGYTEGAHGYTKYGAWSGDPYCQWCAEFLCWCVDQVDQQHGTQYLNTAWPLYSASNVGRNWFIQQGRYIVRWGNLDGWGYQWLRGGEDTIHTGTYIPQPGDWVFFTWTSDYDTDHVALVEYCTQDEQGNVTVHVIEGNNPVAVKRNTYALTYTRILGYGTVHDVADWTCRPGNSGEKVRQLQVKLARMGLLDESKVDGIYGKDTSAAVTAFQQQWGLKDSGIANMPTQQKLDLELRSYSWLNGSGWQVEGGVDTADVDDMDDLSSLDFSDLFPDD